MFNNMVWWFDRPYKRDEFGMSQSLLVYAETADEAFEKLERRFPNEPFTCFGKVEKKKARKWGWPVIH